MVLLPLITKRRHHATPNAAPVRLIMVQLSIVDQLFSLLSACLLFACTGHTPANMIETSNYPSFVLQPQARRRTSPPCITATAAAAALACGQQLGGSWSEAIDNCYCCSARPSSSAAQLASLPRGARRLLHSVQASPSSFLLLLLGLIAVAVVAVVVVVVLLHLEPWARADELHLSQNWFDVSICIGISLRAEHSLRYFLSLSCLHLAAFQSSLVQSSPAIFHLEAE